jgi:hypothetical protein
MRKRVLSSIIAAFMLLGAGAASAQGGATGVITGVMLLGTQYAAVTVTNPVGTAPTCHNGAAGQYAFDISTALGKAMLSAIEGAQIAGRTVGVGGGTGCLTVQSGTSIQTLNIITVF